MTTPLAPDIPTIDTFGAPFVNGDSVVDPETEMDADLMNRLVAQVTMLSHTAAKAWARCTVSGGAITVADHDAVWGNTNGVKPTATYVGTGTFAVNWASSYDDLQDPPESHSVSLRTSNVSGYGTGLGRVFFNSRIFAGHAAVLCSDAAGTGVDPVEFTVWVY